MFRTVTKFMFNVLLEPNKARSCGGDTFQLADAERWEEPPHTGRRTTLTVSLASSEN